jgi:hypothetical protein
MSEIGHDPWCEWIHLRHIKKIRVAHEAQLNQRDGAPSNQALTVEAEEWGRLAAENPVTQLIYLGILSDHGEWGLLGLFPNERL